MLWTIVVGIIAGWLAGLIMKGDGFGLIWDLILAPEMRNSPFQCTGREILRVRQLSHDSTKSDDGRPGVFLLPPRDREKELFLVGNISIRGSSEVRNGC